MPDNAASDELYNKIRALLTLAERATNPNEAAAAASAAARLIQKYNLTEDQVKDWQRPPDIGHERVFLFELTPEYWKPKHIYKERAERARNYKGTSWHGRRKRRYEPRRWPPSAWYEYGQVNWFVYLAGAIARICECEAPYFSPGGVTFVGDKIKIKQAAFLMSNIFTRMLIMCDQAVKDYADQYKAEHGVSPYRKAGATHPNNFRHGWLDGCAHQIAFDLYDLAMDRNMAEAQAARNLAKDNALIILKNAIEKYKEDHFSHVTKTLGGEDDDDSENKRRLGSWRGEQAGSEAGKGFKIQSGLEAGGSVGALKPGKHQ